MHEHSDVGSGDGAAGWDRKKGISPALIVFALLAVLVLIFIIENGHQVPVRLVIPQDRDAGLGGDRHLVAIGVLLDRLFLAWWRRRTHGVTRRTSRRATASS